MSAAAQDTGLGWRVNFANALVGNGQDVMVYGLSPYWTCAGH